MCEAAEELSGGRAYLIAQSVKDDFLRKQTLEDSTRIGEAGELRLVEGKKPSDIVGQLRELLQAKKIRPPASMQSFQGARS